MSSTKALQNHAGFQAGLKLFERAMSLRSRDRSWAEELRTVVADLETLNRSTEADFLAIGGNLMAFLNASRRLRENIGRLTSLVSGEHAQQACEALVSVRGFVHEMRSRSEGQGRAFGTLHKCAASIHRRFSTLGKMALSFQITAILARIETAHLAMSQQDLGNLADEVVSCGDSIQQRAEQVLDAAIVFESRISETNKEVGRLDAIQQRELPALLAAVDGDLERFEARQRDAAVAATKLSADLDSVSRDLGAIATSIQFHDITRQQVEHVIQALNDVLRTGGQGPLTDSGAGQIHLQRAQLKSAASAFGHSTGKIDQDLEVIACRVGNMAEASKSILGLERSVQDSFLSDMQRRFKDVLLTVRESVALAGKVPAMTVELHGLRRRLSTSLEEVQTIEVQLSRISINAAISASHIGATGDPLNVVASAMQTLQTECAARTQDAEREMEAIGEAILFLEGESDRNESKTILLDVLDARLCDLRTSSASSEEGAADMAAAAEALCGDLQAAREHSGIGNLFVATVERCCNALEAMAERANPNRHAITIEGTNERYTMSAERAVHEAVMGAGGDHTVEVNSEEEVEFF